MNASKKTNVEKTVEPTLTVDAVNDYVYPENTFIYVGRKHIRTTVEMKSQRGKTDAECLELDEKTFPHTWLNVGECKVHDLVTGPDPVINCARMVRDMGNFKKLKVTQTVADQSVADYRKTMIEKYPEFAKKYPGQSIMVVTVKSTGRKSKLDNLTTEQKLSLYMEKQPGLYQKFIAPLSKNDQLTLVESYWSEFKKGCK